MKARLVAVGAAVLGLCVVPTTATRAGPPVRGARLCTWGGTPAAPTGVFTASPGVTSTPSSGLTEFTATGELGGNEGCNGRLTFRGVLDPGNTCTVPAPFHARSVGLPPVERAEGGPGVAGSAPVRLYDARGNVVGSEQAQFLTDIASRGDQIFTACNSSEGLTRAIWSDTIEVVAPGDHAGGRR
jgi:hypothetical protein